MRLYDFALKCIKNLENIFPKDVREKYGVLAGTLGIICNLLLFILKISFKNFIVGMGNLCYYSKYAKLF